MPAPTRLSSIKQTVQKLLDAVLKGDRKRTIAVVAAAVVVVVLAFNFLGGRSYKAALGDYIDAQFSGEVDTIIDTIPDEVFDVVCEEEDMTKSEAIEEISETLEDAYSTIDERYDDWDYSYEIVSAEDISKSSLKALQEDYKDEFGLKVKAAKEVEVELTVTADGDEMSQSMNLDMVKIGKSWYLDVLSMGYDSFL